jgi:D-alanine-D-alanine ligase
MDKELMKRLLREASIPIARFLAVSSPMRSKLSFDDVAARLGTPVFVKPANLGSSVGVSKVKSKEEFGPAVAHAFEFDRKILIEEFVSGREIECAVLGNDNPDASLPGEVIPRHEFYSYDAKYLDENGAALEIPARLPEETVRRVQELTVKAFKALSCEGMGRVDFFLKESGELLVNEINTIPGFTKISMYPKLWEASGLSYTKLIDRLIQLALERFEEEKKLKTSFTLL